MHPMENKIPQDTFSLLFSSASKTVEDLEELGRGIGMRISEDFFLRTSATSKISPREVPENMSLFFKTYFSYQPRVEKNVIHLEDFYGFKFGPEKGLLMFKGMFEVIYKFLSLDPVEFEVDESKACMIVNY